MDYKIEFVQNDEERLILVYKLFDSKETFVHDDKCIETNEVESSEVVYSDTIWTDSINEQ